MRMNPIKTFPHTYLDKDHSMHRRMLLLKIAARRVVCGRVL